MLEFISIILKLDVKILSKGRTQAGWKVAEISLTSCSCGESGSLIIYKFIIRKKWRFQRRNFLENQEWKKKLYKNFFVSIEKRFKRKVKLEFQVDHWRVYYVCRVVAIRCASVCIWFCVHNLFILKLNRLYFSF